MIGIGERLLPSNNPIKIKRGLLEGRIITGRSLAEYESLLGFQAEDLKGKRVLNVGVGVSHLGRDLEKRGIKCTLVDFDLKDVKKSFLARFEAFLDKLEAHFDQIEKKYDKDVPKKESAKVDRTFIRGDARALPFKKASFDYSLCSWMIYQLPEQERWKVFDNLMAVSERIYLGPLDRNDITTLQKKATQNNFELREYRTRQGISVILTRQRRDPMSIDDI